MHPILGMRCEPEPKRYKIFCQEMVRFHNMVTFFIINEMDKSLNLSRKSHIITNAGDNDMVVKKEKYEPGGKNKEFKLKIGVKNFGPITSGSIDLRPCTILVGPNNSGKSYFSMLLHSTLEFFKPTAIEITSFGTDRRPRYGIDIDSIWDEFPLIKEEVNALKRGDLYEVPQALIEKMTQPVLDDIFKNRYAQELMRSYSCSLKDLVKIDQKSFSLTADWDSSSLGLELKQDHIKIKQYPKQDFKMYLEVTDGKMRGIFLHDEGLGVSIGEELFKGDGQDYRMYSDQLLDHTVQSCENDLRKKTSIRSFYLPAARSGIIHGYKALVESIVKKALYAGIEKFEIPRFSGVVADFISSLIGISTERGPLVGVAEQFEQDLIEGQVILRSASYVTIPDIKYRFNGKEIPMHRSSSTVSELAPLFIYLKHIIKPGNLLIIEEPEAHLHPKNQRRLASLLVRLIREGVRLFITTHSDYLLEQLSSFILLSRIKDDKKKKSYPYGKDDFLKPEEVGVYVFRFDARRDGYRIEGVEIDDEGISQDEFAKVYEALYEESIKIQEDIQKETDRDVSI